MCIITRGQSHLAVIAVCPLVARCLAAHHICMRSVLRIKLSLLLRRRTIELELVLRSHFGRGMLIGGNPILSVICVCAETFPFPCLDFLNYELWHLLLYNDQYWCLLVSFALWSAPHCALGLRPLEASFDPSQTPTPTAVHNGADAKLGCAGADVPVYATIPAILSLLETVTSLPSGSERTFSIQDKLGSMNSSILIRFEMHGLHSRSFQAHT